MKVSLLGYDIVEYSKNGVSNSFVSVSVSTPTQITYGVETQRVFCSLKYFRDVILPAFEHHSEVHIGFDKAKGGKAFLYLKK